MKIKKFNEEISWEKNDKNTSPEYGRFNSNPSPLRKIREIQPTLNKFKNTYSEEEVLEILEKYDREFKLDTFAYKNAPTFTVEDWFIKNKK